MHSELKGMVTFNVDESDSQFWEMNINKRVREIGYDTVIICFDWGLTIPFTN
jgi:hypothetical protein